ncbi:MAG: YceI family protein [Planctomycetota bacterium]|jgi:polyisoprenoid-binding protein YceI
MYEKNPSRFAGLWVSLGLIAILASVSVVSANPAPLPPQEGGSQVFQVDAMHSSVLFRVKHLNVSNFYGRFNQIKGSFRVDNEDPSKSFIEIEVPTDSVDSNSADRDRHLKSQDFFSAKEFPSITFKSKKIEKTGDDVYRVEGDLTFRGKTKALRFEAQHTGTGKVNDRFGLRSGYEAMIDIKRSDFGDEYGVKGNVLGDDVRLIVSIEGVPEK